MYSVFYISVDQRKVLLTLIILTICNLNYVLNYEFIFNRNINNPAYQCRRLKRLPLDPWAGKIPWRRAWQPTLVFLPGKLHRKRSLEDIVHGVAESDMNEQTQETSMPVADLVFLSVLIHLKHILIIHPRFSQLLRWLF